MPSIKPVSALKNYTSIVNEVTYGNRVYFTNLTFQSKFQSAQELTLRNIIIPLSIIISELTMKNKP